MKLWCEIRVPTTAGMPYFRTGELFDDGERGHRVFVCATCRSELIRSFNLAWDDIDFLVDKLTAHVRKNCGGSGNG